jgi:hypothetical protein
VQDPDLGALHGDPYLFALAGLPETRGSAVGSLEQILHPALSSLISRDGAGKQVLVIGHAVFSARTIRHLTRGLKP